MPEPLPPRTWGVLAYIMADQAFLSVEQGEKIDRIASDEAKKLARAARGLDDMYLAVHVDLTQTSGSLRYQVPGPLEPEHRPEGRAGFSGLMNFLEGARQACPAKYYMVILWGHGSGPLGLFDDPTGAGAKGSGHLRLRDLHSALTTLKQKSPPGAQQARCAADILMVKSCYMATLEAACELDSLVDYLICSQAQVPLRTWTIWEDVFEALAGPPEAAAGKMLRAIDQHYSDVVERNDEAEIPFSLLRPAGVRRQQDDIVALVTALAPYRNDPDVAAAIEGARPASGGDKALLDVRTLCANLIELYRPGLSDVAARLDMAMKPAIVIDNVPLGSRFGGVGVFHFPPDPLLRVQSFANEVTQDVYTGSLDFPKLTGWGNVAFPWQPAPKQPSATASPGAASAAVI